MLPIPTSLLLASINAAVLVLRVRALRHYFWAFEESAPLSSAWKQLRTLKNGGVPGTGERGVGMRGDAQDQMTSVGNLLLFLPNYLTLAF